MFVDLDPLDEIARLSSLRRRVRWNVFDGNDLLRDRPPRRIGGPGRESGQIHAGGSGRHLDPECHQ
jgi:hypothetical protein